MFPETKSRETSGLEQYNIYNKTLYSPRQALNTSKTKSLLWTGCFAKFQSKDFFKIQEYPRVDDFEG